MGKWRAGFSGFMAVAVLAGSISADAAVQEWMAVYEGALICGQEEHTHDRFCYDQASPSDAKEVGSDMVCGREEHVHDGDCYERGENTTGTLTPAEALPDQTPGSEETGTTEESGSEKTPSEGTDQENGKTESSGMEGTERKEKDSEEDQEEVVALMSAMLERSGDTFQVHTFAELEAAIEEANKEDAGEGYQIVLQDDIEWDDTIWVDTSILLDMNGHSIRISKECALLISGSLAIQGNDNETITIASSIEISNPYDSYIIEGGGDLVLDNVRITAEDSQKELPALVRSVVYGSCTLNDVTVEDYPVYGSLFALESAYGLTDPPTALTIQGGSFSGIRSDGWGAIVGATAEKEDDQQYYSPGRIVIHDAIFKDNSAESGGVVCVCSENGLEITGSVFERNQATERDGGAVLVEEWVTGDIDIDGCVFIDNDAAGKGGAIYCRNNNLSITNGTFEGNKASDGGAVAFLVSYSNTVSDAHICETTFTDNRAENNGGAVYADGTVHMEEVTLLDNKAQYRGGAVYMEENLSKDGTSQSELILADAVITGNDAPENGHAVECTYSLQMEGERCPAIFENHPTAGDSIYLHPSVKAGAVYGTMLGEGDAGLEILYESGAEKQILQKGETAVVDPSRDGAIRLAFHPSGTKGILALSPVVRMEGNTGGLTGSAIYGTSITFITSEKKIPEEPEKPEPEKPEPEKPEPEKPEPEKPEPEKPKPGTGSSSSGGGGSSSSGGGGSSSSGGGGSVSRAESSSSSQGRSITKPHYIHSVTGGREMSDTRPGWRLRKPDGSYAVSEWVLETDGSWYLYGEDGYTCSGWQKVNGEWYFFDETAQNMKTGWLMREGKWYYLDLVNGPMKTGWILLEGKWYFLSPDGALVTNGYTPDGYYVDENGEWKEKVLAVKNR